MDLAKIMQQAQEMQQKMQDLQKQLEENEESGSSGGGMVTVVMNGKGLAKQLKIDPSLVNPNEIELLEDLVVAAYNDAKQKAELSFSRKMAEMAQNMGLPPGMKLPFGN
jgi:DNA-binding YbaB/EbfC family protein